jgi:hypothetical protein
MLKPLPALTIAACLFAVLPARADGAITRLIMKEDAQRLAGFDQTRKEALAQARSGSAPADLAVLEKVLAASPINIQDFDMGGTWQCRTIKVGGNLPLVVYGWFNCRVIDDGAGWRLTKLTGSQRTDGRFYTDTPTRQIYLGTSFTAGEKPQRYGEDREANQVGYVFRTGAEAWRIEFPQPIFESKLDILELKR